MSDHVEAFRRFAEAQDLADFSLDEALAIRCYVRTLGYPTREQVQALRAADAIIKHYACEAMRRFRRGDSAAPG